LTPDYPLKMGTRKGKTTPTAIKEKIRILTGRV
jgi:hypothetical protein